MSKILFCIIFLKTGTLYVNFCYNSLFIWLIL
uniref:Uncharacterized protein n=1 Tax=Anguilla anguilla TaxID=7936 RepID=A0A0E9RKI3_ANGAN